MKWQPLQRVTATGPVPPGHIAGLMRRIPGLTEADAIGIPSPALRRAPKHDRTILEFWKNDLYVVGLRRGYDTYLIWLTIRRCDGKAIYRDWRHFQAIKNQLIGEECEAIELYPAESRLVDTANQYHLFGIANPSFRFPFGFKHRQVNYTENNEASWLAQRGVDSDTCEKQESR